LIVSEVTAVETPKLVLFVLLLDVEAEEAVASICFWQEVKIKPIIAANKILFIPDYLYVKELIITCHKNTNRLVFIDQIVTMCDEYIIFS
jgi:hypothetical protein